MSWLYPDRGDFIAVVGRMQDISAVRQVKAALLSSKELSVYSINAPDFIPGIDFSDHLNYWQQDIPAVMITDTAFYRNKQYHQPGDTADRLNRLCTAWMFRWDCRKNLYKIVEFQI